MSASSPSVESRAAAVLIKHHRVDLAACSCGWAELGRSHADHQVEVLVREGLLANDGRRGDDAKPDPGQVYDLVEGRRKGEIR